MGLKCAQLLMLFFCGIEKLGCKISKKKMRNCYFPPSLPGWFVAVGMVVVAYDAPMDCGLVAAVKFLK